MSTSHTKISSTLGKYPKSLIPKWLLEHCFIVVQTTIPSRSVDKYGEEIAGDTAVYLMTEFIPNNPHLSAAEILDSTDVHDAILEHYEYLSGGGGEDGCLDEFIRHRADKEKRCKELDKVVDEVNPYAVLAGPDTSDKKRKKPGVGRFPVKPSPPKVGLSLKGRLPIKFSQENMDRYHQRRDEAQVTKTDSTAVSTVDYQGSDSDDNSFEERKQEKNKERRKTWLFGLF